MRRLGSKSPLGSLIIVLPLALAAASCSAGNAGDGSSSGPAQGGSGATSGNGATGGGDAGGSGGSGGGGGMIVLPGGGNGNDGGGPGFAICAEGAVEANLAPLDMFVLLDRSGSMTAANKWPTTINALEDFFEDPASEGLTAGLQMFPDIFSGTGDSCDPADYDQMVVEPGPIGPNQTATLAMVQAMTAPGNQPDQPSTTFTPLYGAMEEILWDATGYQDAFPEHKVVVILATDGVPSDCPTIPFDQNDMGNIALLAGSAYNYNQVRTYAIAMAGAQVAELDKVAAAGGTSQSINITSDITLFKLKMDEIRKESLECTIAVPAPDGDAAVDPDLVELTYTPGDESSPPSEIPHVANEASCGSSPGFYFSEIDSMGSPTEITLCANSCELVQQDSEATLEIVAGCVDSSQ